MDEMKALVIIAVTAIVVGGVVTMGGEIAKQDKSRSQFAAECNKAGGIARQIDGTLNCVKGPV